MRQFDEEKESRNLTAIFYLPATTKDLSPAIFHVFEFRRIGFRIGENINYKVDMNIFQREIQS